MSPTVRTGLVFGLGIIGVILGTSLLNLVVPLAGCLGFISVIVLGLAAGYTAAKVSNATRDQRIARGATAGAIAGLLTLIGSIVVLTIITQLPAFQAQVQAGITEALQSDPNLSGSAGDISQYAGLISGAGGVLGGFCSGLFYMVILVITGLLGALFWKGAPAAAAYVPAGGSTYTPPSGSFIPNQTDSDTGARVYDADDPNRPR